MPRYYCDYCDTYLTHDSPSVRKQHNAGYKHKANVRSYYQQFEEQQTQSLIDQRIKEHLGQYGQVGGAFAAWPRPPMVRPPILPAPGMPGAIPSNAPMMPGIRPPILPRPGVPPGYGTAPGTAPVPGQPGVPVAPTQPNGPPGTPMSAPGSGPMPLNSGSNGGLPTSSLPAYQASPASGGFGTSMAPTNSYPGGGGSGAYTANSGADGFGYAQAPNNH